MEAALGCESHTQACQGGETVWTPAHCRGGWGQCPLLPYYVFRVLPSNRETSQMGLYRGRN